MRTKESNNRTYEGRNTVLISDMAIIDGGIKSPLFKLHFEKKKAECIAKGLFQLIRFICACFAHMHWSVFRVRPGAQTIGLIVTGLNLSFLLSFNAQEIEGWHKLFSVFLTLVLIFQQPFEELVITFTENVESTPLLIYSGLYLLMAIVQIVMIWIGKGSASLSQRGHSILGLIISRWVKPHDYFLEGWIEPLLAIGLGYYFWAYHGDIHFALILWISAGCEWLQQLVDKSHQMSKQAILNA